MAGRVTLNQVYRAINFALGIDRPRQFEVFQQSTKPVNKSMVSGFSKHSEDNRYRHVTHSILMAYCGALKSQPDLQDNATELQMVIETLEAGDQLGEDCIDHWEEISEKMGNGPIWQKLAHKGKIRE